MHQISENSIQQARQHVATVSKHGLQLVALGESLKKDNNFCVQQCGQFIEQQGWLIQEHARSSLAYVQKLSTCDFSSTELYIKAVEARSKATILYSEAMIIYTQVVQGKHWKGKNPI
jgi:hypothetical protein